MPDAGFFLDTETKMTDIAELERSILTEIEAAGDEAAIEAVRVSALGKKGSISAQMKTLGKMSPEERQTMGAGSQRSAVKGDRCNF